MSEGNGDSNGAGVKVQRAKKLGGVTGKGFKPGQSGNPKGGKMRPKEFKHFSHWLRGWLHKMVRETDDQGKPFTVRRVEVLVGRLAEQKPEILLYYAYGKPVETHEITDPQGNPVEFVVKVSGVELP